MLNLESDQTFQMDELVDSLLEPRTYRLAKKQEEQKESELAEKDDVEQIEEAAIPEFISQTDNHNL